MVIAKTVREVRTGVHEARRAGRRIACVPTMGALHAGHFALVDRARAECDYVVATLFVNPTQFVAGEDLETYPRTFDADAAGCEQRGVDLVFAPSVEAMYGTDPATTVGVERLTAELCGPHRRGHFDGVTTVVTMLFNIVQPDAAYFGQKDGQQAVVIRKMVADLHFPIEIVVCETVREPDGLAVSSRNVYLTPDQRRQAVSLSQALRMADRQIAEGQRDAATLVAMIREHLQRAGPCTIDYVEIVGAGGLEPLTTVAGRAMIALAVRIGETRLIDNVVVDAGPTDD